MIKLYQDPIFGSQYYSEEIPEVKGIKYTPKESDFSLDEWKELIVQHKVPFNRRILNANKRDNQDFKTLK